MHLRATDQGFGLAFMPSTSKGFPDKSRCTKKWFLERPTASSCPRFVSDRFAHFICAMTFQLCTATPKGLAMVNSTGSKNWPTPLPTKLECRCCSSSVPRTTRLQMGKKTRRANVQQKSQWLNSHEEIHHQGLRGQES